MVTLTLSVFPCGATLVKLPRDWDERRIRDVLGDAGRLLIGNGTDYPFTFVHPRIADFFQRMASERKGEVESIRNAFLTWGKGVVGEVNAGAMNPSECPSYLLHHYLAHIETAAPPDAQTVDFYYLPVLEGGWHKAWHAEEGAYRGFLFDLRRMEMAFHKQNLGRPEVPPYLIEEIRCLLYRASVKSLTALTPPPLLRELLRTGLWTVGRILRHAESVDDPKTRFDVAMEAAAAAGSSAERLWALDVATAAAEGIRHQEARANALGDLVAHLAGERTLLERALTAAQAIGDNAARADALAELAARRAGEATRFEATRFKKALTATEAIRDEQARASVVRSRVSHIEGDAMGYETLVNVVLPFNNRAIVLDAIGLAVPALNALGGPDSLVRLAADIDRFAEWFP